MSMGQFVADVRAAMREEPVRLVHRAHGSPGRVRFRLSWLRDFPEDAPGVAEALSAVAGVCEVRVRAFTGSVLVLFDPEFVDEERVTRALVEAVGVDHVCAYGRESDEDRARLLHDADRRGSDISRALVAAVEGLHTDFLRLTGGRVSLASASALAMLVAGLTELAKTEGIEMPAWHQLLWYAYQTFKDVQDRYAAGHQVHVDNGNGR